MPTPKPRTGATVQAIDAFLEKTSDFSAIAQQYESEEVKSSYRVIERIYDRLWELRQARYSYETITLMLRELLGLNISPVTLRDYMSRIKDKRTHPSPPKTIRPKKVRALSPAKAQSTQTQSAQTQSAQPDRTPVHSLPAPSPPTPTKLPDFTPDELEAALQIPQPSDQAGIERFQRGLEQIKTIDPKRWRILRSQALDQGINLLGIIMPSVEKINALFNQY